ncbi:hypothetical protein [Rossellomorea aquimaris]|uniref:hypothetical protein n=1 Tax=Rossellomorea aquimaris TaxID=189382 RepID=UPI0011E8C0AA|nr:hypothetical protein [Rossellomorea aquimaris]TYS89832.1 hypothetical protein FZC88_09555 [Rossellomorea aquimaris]
MQIYYAMLIIGAVLLLIGVFWFIYMFKEKEFTLSNTCKALFLLIFSGLLLIITLPSLKYMLFQEYDVVKGSCTIEIDSSGRTSEASFKMDDSSDVFYFRDIPDLDSYGRAVPYYCELTVTKDHEFEISYKIYDSTTRELIQTSE